MDLLGAHKVSYESIRRLAIECHALSSSAQALLERGDYEDAFGRTREVYEELISEKLLGLAISIRTKFYQGDDHRRTSGFLEEVGWLCKGLRAEEADVQRRFTLKDFCDKVLHASSVHFVVDPEFDTTYMSLHGNQLVKGATEPWTLTVWLDLVSKGILGWLDALADDAEDTSGA